MGTGKGEEMQVVLPKREVRIPWHSPLLFSGLPSVFSMNQTLMEAGWQGLQAWNVYESREVND